MVRRVSPDGTESVARWYEECRQMVTFYPFLATKLASPTPTSTRGSGRQGRGYALRGDPRPAETNQYLSGTAEPAMTIDLASALRTKLKPR